MKIYTLLVLLFLFFSSNVFSKVIVISDLDDTIKQTNSMGKLSQVYHFFRNKEFVRTKEIFIELDKNFKDGHEDVEFHYVSAAPKYIFSVKRWLKRKKFPEGKVYQRKIGSPDTFSFKYLTIYSILKDQANDPELKVIFFGDNSSHDHDVYWQVKRDLKVKSHIFIRDVSTKGTEFSDKLSVMKIKGVNFFFSERDLLELPFFSFLSDGLKEKINKDYAKRKLIPKYTEKTLRKRIRKREKCLQKDYMIDTIRCYKTCKKEAKNYIKAYYTKYL
jgi:hypothetical protein